ncbi:hypothetical protein PV325_004297 [Microctonus aethiopoides]|nr:hypothetical protein PV325_004297 [Microctonus aethiopoides]
MDNENKTTENKQSLPGPSMDQGERQVETGAEKKPRIRFSDAAIPREPPNREDQELHPNQRDAGYLFVYGILAQMT